MNKKITTLALVGVALLQTGCTEEQLAAVEKRPVQTIVADRTSLVEQRTAVGEIKPFQQSDLSFQVSGKIINRFANLGDLVKPGEVIARLDPRDYAKRLSAAQADLTAAEASFAEASSAEARQKKLLEKGVVARASYDTALRNRRSAEAALESARIAKSMAADQLSYTELKAEVNGVVTSIAAEAEQYVNPGQAVVSVAPKGGIDAVFSIAEAALQDGFFTLGGHVEITLLSDPSVTAKGTVREVSPKANSATRTFEVKVALANPPGQLMFGSSVTGEAVLSKRSGIALPGSAIFDDKGKPAVWVFDRTSESVSLKAVNVAQYDTEYAIVSHGIEQGDVIVTAGANQLRQGEKVRLLQE